MVTRKSFGFVAIIFLRFVVLKYDGIVCAGIPENGREICGMD